MNKNYKIFPIIVGFLFLILAGIAVPKKANAEIAVTGIVRLNGGCFAKSFFYYNKEKTQRVNESDPVCIGQSVNVVLG